MIIMIIIIVIIIIIIIIIIIMKSRDGAHQKMQYKEFNSGFH